MSINLLPQQHREEKKFVAFVNEIFFGVFAILMFMIIAEILFYAYNTKLESKVAAATQKISAIVTDISSYSELSGKLDKVQAKTTKMYNLKNNPVPQSQVLALISQSVTDSIQLTSISSDLENNLVTVTGIAKSADSLNLMQSALRKDEMVKEVSFVLDSSSAADQYIFTTKIKLGDK
jgi:Tfp pilus assembly protein PilN